MRSSLGWRITPSEQPSAAPISAVSSTFSTAHSPETSAAVDSLYMQQLDIRIFADEFFRAAIPADSL